MNKYYEEVKKEVSAWPKWKKDFFKALRINDDTYYIRCKKKKVK